MNVKRSDRRVLLVVSLLLVSAMAGLSQAQEIGGASEETPTDEKELSAYKERGTGAVSGQAFMVTRGRDAIYEPGGEVWLVPLKASILKSLMNDLKADNPEADRVKKKRSPYLRITHSNPTGHFWFRKVPPGKYVILAPIFWDVSGKRQGGIAEAEVELENGENLANVVVTR